MVYFLQKSKYQKFYSNDFTIEKCCQSHPKRFYSQKNYVRLKQDNEKHFLVYLTDIAKNPKINCKHKTNSRKPKLFAKIVLFHQMTHKTS